MKQPKTTTIQIRLTARQAMILRYIEDAIALCGVAPSYQEIADRFSIASKAGVAKHLAALKVKGCIAVEPGPRGIKVLRGMGGGHA